MTTRRRWIDIDSPSRIFSGTPTPRRPWWHYTLDNILDGLTTGILTCGPYIVGGLVGALTYWILTR